MQTEHDRSADESPTCHYKTCGKDADFVLAYTESGAPETKKPACRSHKNMEQIHDPFNVEIHERLD